MNTTFYSVKYFNGFYAENKWFTNLTEAKNFYYSEHAADKPITHNFRDPEKIEHIEFVINLQE